MFCLMWQSPFGWLTLNLLIPTAAIYEYSLLHAGILKDMHASRSGKYLALHEKLVSHLCQKHVTGGMLISYHLVILTLPGKYIGLALLLLFIIVIY